MGVRSAPPPRSQTWRSRAAVKGHRCVRGAACAGAQPPGDARGAETEPQRQADLGRPVCVGRSNSVRLATVPGSHRVHNRTAERVCSRGVMRVLGNVAPSREAGQSPGARDRSSQHRPVSASRPSHGRDEPCVMDPFRRPASVAQRESSRLLIEVRVRILPGARSTSGAAGVIGQRTRLLSAEVRVRVPGGAHSIILTPRWSSGQDARFSIGRSRVRIPCGVRARSSPVGAGELRRDPTLAARQHGPVGMAQWTNRKSRRAFTPEAAGSNPVCATYGCGARAGGPAADSAQRSGAVGSAAGS